MRKEIPCHEFINGHWAIFDQGRWMRLCGMRFCPYCGIRFNSDGTTTERCDAQTEPQHDDH